MESKQKNGQRNGGRGPTRSSAKLRLRVPGNLPNRRARSRSGVASAVVASALAAMSGEVMAQESSLHHCKPGEWPTVEHAEGAAAAWDRVRDDWLAAVMRKYEESMAAINAGRRPDQRELEDGGVVRLVQARKEEAELVVVYLQRGSVGLAAEIEVRQAAERERVREIQEATRGLGLGDPGRGWVIPPAAVIEVAAQVCVGSAAGESSSMQSERPHLRARSAMAK